MDSISSAVSFARALWALRRGAATGVLTARGDAQHCRIALVDGTPRAATQLRAETTLGDALVAEGDLDLGRHGRALFTAPPQGPVGGWLVSQRLASGPAVALALRVQLRRRVLRVLAFRGIEYGFTPGAAEVGLVHVDEPVSTADLVMSGMRRLLGQHDMRQLAPLLPRGRVRLTDSGLQLLDEAALWPSEAAIVPLLRRGADLAALTARAQDCDRARRTVAALCLLGVAQGRRVRPSSYALLARKRRELRRRSPAHALLDLPAHASPDEARRALRRLALHLHPDQLGPDAPPPILRASTEVMGALIAAEGHLRLASRLD